MRSVIATWFFSVSIWYSLFWYVCPCLQESLSIFLLKFWEWYLCCFMRSFIHFFLTDVVISEASCLKFCNDTLLMEYTSLWLSFSIMFVYPPVSILHCQFHTKLLKQFYCLPPPSCSPIGYHQEDLEQLPPHPSWQLAWPQTEIHGGPAGGADRLITLTFILCIIWLKYRRRIHCYHCKRKKEEKREFCIVLKYK